MISDPEINDSLAQSDATSAAGTAVASASTTAVLDAESGLPCDSPMRNLHLAAGATAQSGGSAYKLDTSPNDNKDLSVSPFLTERSVPSAPSIPALIRSHFFFLFFLRAVP
jgi:hypothetical protein